MRTRGALQAAAVSLHVLAIGTSLWIAFRRGGPGSCSRSPWWRRCSSAAYGTVILTEAWNPYLPVMWWLAFVLAVWSIVSDDPPMLPVAVFAGSFCMQTHLPYLGLSGGLLAGALAFAFYRAHTRRLDVPGGMRRLVGWTLLAAAVGVVLWLPPVIEELTHSHGNLTIIQHELTDPPQSPIGAGRGWSCCSSTSTPGSSSPSSRVPRRVRSSPVWRCSSPGRRRASWPGGYGTGRSCASTRCWPARCSCPRCR